MIDLDDLDLLPAERLEEVAHHAQGVRAAWARSVSLPTEAVERLLSQLPTISDYDHRCWSCRADFSRQINYVRDPAHHDPGCAWAIVRREVDRMYDNSPPF